MSKVKLYVLRIKGDDPKKSTALKLVRLGLARRVRFSDVPPKAIVLDPFSDYVLSPLDRSYIEGCGLVVIDTSWNKPIHELKAIFSRVRGVHRVLPLLFAGNPINYAVPTKLSSVEALAAALYITGFKDEARLLLSKFKWGHTFIELNRELLEGYSSANDVNDVLRIQDSVLRKIKS